MWYNCVRIKDWQGSRYPGGVGTEKRLVSPGDGDWQGSRYPGGVGTEKRLVSPEVGTDRAPGILGELGLKDLFLQEWGLTGLQVSEGSMGLQDWLLQEKLGLFLIYKSRHAVSYFLFFYNLLFFIVIL